MFVARRKAGDRTRLTGRCFSGFFLLSYQAFRGSFAELLHPRRASRRRALQSRSRGNEDPSPVGSDLTTVDVIAAAIRRMVERLNDGLILVDRRGHLAVF